MWFKVDDGFADHDKTAAALDGHPLSVTLWTLTGSKCGKALTDGVVAPAVVSRCSRMAGMSSAAAGKAAASLVASGLWHDSKSIRRCDHCSTVKLPAGSFFFHDWWDYNPCKDETLIPTGRVRWRRKEELRRNRKLCEAIDTRDRNQCRYCSVRVNWKDKRGTKGGTRDHVDPDGDNSLANVVVACRKCNGDKRDRTPEEWAADEGAWSLENPTGGRLLLPEPEPYQPTQAEPGRSPSPTQDEPGRDLASRARGTRDGAGQVGPRQDLGHAQIGTAPAPVTASNGSNGHRPADEGNLS